MLGYADLAASLGRTAAPERQLQLWLPVQSALLVAARSAGVAAVDGPYLGVQVDEGFSAAVERAVTSASTASGRSTRGRSRRSTRPFSPTDDEVAHARAVLEALERGARDGAAGAVLLDGQMLDEAVAVGARRVLARAGGAA